MLAETSSQRREGDFRVSIFLNLPKQVPITGEMSNLGTEKGGRDLTAL